MIPDELDIEDISDIRRITRPMLLAALTLTETSNDIAEAAIDWNAHTWDLGIHAMGGVYPHSFEGVVFTPTELDTVVRLARYFVAREQPA
ncbi:MAG: hypothetical protein AB7R89_11550 [Dehalococcoidia bacterium]